MRTRILAEFPRVSGGSAWLTTADVARMLEVTTDGVRWLARRGHLASQRTHSGQWLFRPGDAHRFAERRLQARLQGLPRARPRRTDGEPRQLVLAFGPPLQIVGRRRKWHFGIPKRKDRDD